MFESLLERDLLTLLEFNDSVMDAEEQPFTITYENSNGRKVTYTPDFLVTFHSLPQSSSMPTHKKPMIIEVKPSGVLKRSFMNFVQSLKLLLDMHKRMTTYSSSMMTTVYAV